MAFCLVLLEVGSTHGLTGLCQSPFKHTSIHLPHFSTVALGQTFEYHQEFSCPANLDQDSVHKYQERVSYATQSRHDFKGTPYQKSIDYFGIATGKFKSAPSPLSQIENPSRTILIRDADKSQEKHLNHNQSEAPVHEATGGRSIFTLRHECDRSELLHRRVHLVNQRSPKSIIY